MPRKAYSFIGPGNPGAPVVSPAERAFSRDAFLLLLVDIGLLSVIFIAPLFMGGRYEIGRLAYVIAVCFTAIAWSVRQALTPNASWRWTGAEWLLLAGLALIVLQLIPLPESVLLALSPELGELLPVWTSSGDSAFQLDTWQQLSLDPQATRSGLVIYLAHALLFLVVTQRIQSFHDVERLLRWLALAAIAMATLGLAQFLLGNGKFLWIYEHPFRDTYGKVRGTFQNQNHFAHFLVLGIGPLIWWLQRLWRSHKKTSFRTATHGHDTSEYLKHAVAIGFGVVLLAGLLTFSRGGVIAMFVATAVCVAVLAKWRLLGRKSLVALAGFALLMVAALAIYGYEPLAKRLSTLRDSESLEELSKGRQALWSAHLKAIPHFWPTGTGAGTHREIYRTYLEEDFGVEFTHGENGYLHQLLEGGAAGLALMLAGAGLALLWCLQTLLASKDKELVACCGALLAGLVASLFHSLGDFVWYIPACMSLTVITLACVCRLRSFAAEGAGALDNRLTPGRRRGREGKFTSKSAIATGLGTNRENPKHAHAEREAATARGPALSFTWALIACGIVGVSLIMLSNRTPPALAALDWDAYYKISRAAGRDADQDEQQAREQIAAMTAHLQRVVGRDPLNARANLRLAGMYLRRFDIQQQASDNPMPLSQIRDAALASASAPEKEQERWLNNVLGKNRALLDRSLYHTRVALQLCPLQGEGYIYLAELAFLEGSSPAATSALIDQALKVRPHSGTVLMAAGSEAALAGDVGRAMEHWKRAFHQDQQSRIIELLAPQMSAEVFLEQFKPDYLGQGRLYHFYRRNQMTDQAREIGASYVLQLETEASDKSAEGAAPLWGQASAVHSYLGDTTRAAECAHQASWLAPNDFAVRRLLATALVADGKHEEAVEQLEWCLRRAPDDPGLKQMLHVATRQRIENGGPAFR